MMSTLGRLLRAINSLTIDVLKAIKIMDLPRGMRSKHPNSVVVLPLPATAFTLMLWLVVATSVYIAC